jgi:hypothetical protein
MRLIVALATLVGCAPRDLESALRRTLARSDHGGWYRKAPLDSAMDLVRGREPEATAIVVRIAREKGPGRLRANALRLYRRIEGIRPMPAGPVNVDTLFQSSRDENERNDALYRALLADSDPDVRAAAAECLLLAVYSDEALHHLRGELEGTGGALLALASQDDEAALALLRLEGAPIATRWLIDAAAGRKAPLPTGQLADAIAGEPSAAALDPLTTLLRREPAMRPGHEPRHVILMKGVGGWDRDTAAALQIIRAIAAIDPIAALELAADAGVPMRNVAMTEVLPRATQRLLAVGPVELSRLKPRVARFADLLRSTPDGVRALARLDGETPYVQ